jgi:mRNA-degrading endonuclease RelE of RelBE toxin-antitoxin system
VAYQVLVLPGAREDLRELAERDREVLRAALRLASQLEGNPWLGDELRACQGLQELRDGRRIRFDRADWTDKPRYRLVYRNEPSDGAPHIVAILAVGERRNLGAYRRAKPRIVERLRALGESREDSRQRRTTG